MNRVIGKINRIVAPKSSDRLDVLDHAHWTLRTFYLQESPSFLKKRSKKLCEFGFGLSPGEPKPK